MRFGVLDSAPVRAGGSVADALADSLARAGRLEELGCHRLWFTEHHLAPDVASSAPLTLVGEAATRTHRMRLGAGGVMIRNHAPLVAAEQAATLSLLHPGRVDVGLGRSGGSELDWSAGERYRVDGMLEAALVGSEGTVHAQLRDVARRLAPDEVMAMTDLPDPGVTLRSHTRLAGIVAAPARAGATP